MIARGIVLQPELSIDLEPDATTLYDLSRYKNNGTMLGAGEPNAVQLPRGLWVWDFDGTDDIITIGNTLQSIRSALLWIYPDDITTRSIVDFDSGTHSIEISGASAITATGWAAPTIYVNGVVAAAVALQTWACLAITTATAFAVSALILGQEASFYDGKIGLIILYNYALTAGQVLNRYESTRWLFGV